MKHRVLLALLIGGALLWWYFDRHERRQPAPPPSPPPAKPEPKKPDEPRPKKPRRPCPGPGPCPLEDKEIGVRPVEGGRVSPDGAVEIVCDLPASQRKKNIASKGLGCCVFRSIDYAARWQQVHELYDLPEQLVQAGIEGGGYPHKVEQVLARFAPGVPYLQDTSGDPDILEAILQNRPHALRHLRRPRLPLRRHYRPHGLPAPFRSRSPIGLCVCDNNFPDDGRLVWMSSDEFLQRWKGGGGGWVVCLLKSPPPPPPHN